MTRVILHIDLDAFFCSVEELINPSLKRKPFAVGGSPEGRGVVASCSYAARTYGIRSAMPMSRAMKLCPELMVISSHYSDYAKYSHKVTDYLHSVTPLVEKVSIDEAFLDVSEINESGVSIAERIQTRILKDLGLPSSIGVATNKLIAKTANDFGKSATTHLDAPNAITVIPPGQEADFLAPMPVEALSGIGPKTAEHLETLGVITIGELARYPISELTKQFGRNGASLHKRAQGIDNSPITLTREVKSISNERTFANDISQKEFLLETILNLSKSVGNRLRHNNMTARTVKIKLRWPDFRTITRQISVDQPTDNDQIIYSKARHLFETSWNYGDALRLIGVGISGLEHSVRQLSFWDEVDSKEKEKDKKLQLALKQIHERFGDDVIKQGIEIQANKNK